MKKSYKEGILDDRNKPGTPERIIGFSDGVFAVIITIMVLDLKKPEDAHWRSLVALWPVILSYMVSYLFIAVVWVNHHFLLKHANRATQRLIWSNFVHLFSVSFVPFLTAWIAETHFQPLPVAMYALIFLIVNITYLILIRESFRIDKNDMVVNRVRRLLQIRSLITISLFTTAFIISFWWPLVGFTIICCCLLLYLRPEAPPV
jgi:uncharacterized membrane protein